jgi:hypothetical protein
LFSLDSLVRIGTFQGVTPIAGQFQLVSVQGQIDARGIGERAPGGRLCAWSIEGSSLDDYSTGVAFSEEIVAEEFASQSQSFR